MTFTERRSGNRSDVEAYWKMLDVPGFVLERYTLYGLYCLDDAFPVSATLSLVIIIVLEIVGRFQVL